MPAPAPLDARPQETDLAKSAAAPSPAAPRKARPAARKTAKAALPAPTPAPAPAAAPRARKPRAPSPTEVVKTVARAIEASPVGKAGAVTSAVLRTRRAGQLSRRVRNKIVVVTGATSGIGRDCALKLAAAGATVIGVSLDSIKRLNTFSADPEFCAGKLAVASDPDGRIARSFDLAVSDIPAGRKDTRGEEIDHGRVDRVSFVIRPDGKVAATIGGLAPVANVEKALETVTRLASARR